MTDRTSQPQIISKLGKPFALSDIRVIRLAQRKRSVVVTGDGETGMQPSHASFGTNLSAIAAGTGIPRSYQLNSLDGVPELVHAIECRTETVFCQVLAEATSRPMRCHHGRHLPQAAIPRLTGPEALLTGHHADRHLLPNAHKELTVRTANVISVSCGCSTMRRERERAHQWHWSA